MAEPFSCRDNPVDAGRRLFSSIDTSPDRTIRAYFSTGFDPDLRATSARRRRIVGRTARTAAPLETESWLCTALDLDATPARHARHRPSPTSARSFLFHKTTNREVLHARRPDCDDVLLWNRIARSRNRRSRTSSSTLAGAKSRRPSAAACWLNVSSRAARVEEIQESIDARRAAGGVRGVVDQFRPGMVPALHRDR
jgi:hypothetical protein